MLMSFKQTKRIELKKKIYSLEFRASKTNMVIRAFGNNIGVSKTPLTSKYRTPKNSRQDFGNR